MQQYIIQIAAPEDREALAELRVQAMKPSLEQIGRFDPERAKARFIKSFDWRDTQKIIAAKKLIGFYVLSEKEDHLYLDHFYLRKSFQGLGIGGEVLAGLQRIANKKNLPIRLGALRDSLANKFYTTNGFEATHEEEWDIYYQYLPN